LTPWPKWDPKLVKEEMITLIIQVNGKLRDKVEVEANISKEKAKELAISREKIKKWIEGKEIKKVIFVPGKLINIVVE
jgi:leucyl-tRNA synthetase